MPHDTPTSPLEASHGHAVESVDFLQDMMDRQLALQRLLHERRGTSVPGEVPCLQDRDHRTVATYHDGLCYHCLHQVEEGIQFNCRSLFHEVAELEDWTRWKAWSEQLGNKAQIEIGSSEHLKEMQLEAVDQLHFLMNIFAWLGMDAATIHRLYVEKWKINIDRQAQGNY